MSLLTRIFGGAPSLEDPATSLGDAFVSKELLGAQVSASGIPITVDNALTSAAFYRGVFLLSNTIAKLPLMVFARADDGSKEPAKTHPAYRLLRRRPNEWMTAYEWKWLAQAQVLLYGNHYSLVERNGRQEPVSLLPLDPRSTVTFPVRKNGVLFIVTNHARPNQAILPAREVVHLKCFFDGLTGHGVIEHAANSLGLTLGAEAFGSVFFRNAATPRFVLEHPGNLSEQAAKRLAESFQVWHSGLENAHKVGLLEEGMKAKPLSLSAEDAQLIETRKLQTRDVAVWLGIPPHMLGDDTRTSFASLEQENQSFLDNSIDPWLVSFEEEFESKLLSEAQNNRESHVIDFVRQALLRADLGTRASWYSTAVEKGLMSRNEIRARENLPPVEGGDVFLVPLNLGTVEDEKVVPLDENEEEPQVEPGETEEGQEEDLDRDRFRAAARATALDASRRAARRLVRSSVRIATKEPGTFLAHLDEFFNGHREALDEMFRAPAAVGAAVTGRCVAAETVVEALIRETTEQLLSVSEVRESEFGAAVETWARYAEDSLATITVELLVPDEEG